MPVVLTPEYSAAITTAPVPLDIVVEHAVFRRVLVEDRARVAGSEVLEMQHRGGEQPVGSLDVVLDERVVFGAAPAGVAVADVERVVEQLFVVGADIEGHRDGAPGIDATAGGVERKFPDRDLDAADAPITDAQDRLGVGAHDQIDIIRAQPQRLEGFGDLVVTIDGQIQPTLAAVLAGESLDRLAHRRGVHHRHQLGQMLREHLEVQHLVAVVQLIEQ